MKPLRIDFGPSRRAPAWWAGCALLVVGVALSAGVGWRYRVDVHARAPLQAEYDRLQEVSRQPTDAPADAPGSLSSDRLEQVAQAAAHLDIPWDALLAGIEAAMDERVALLGLEPDVLQGSLLLRGEARDIQAVFDFVQRVDAAPLLADVHLDQHQVSLQDPQRPIQFTLAARWSGLALPTQRANGPDKEDTASRSLATPGVR